MKINAIFFLSITMIMITNTNSQAPINNLYKEACVLINAGNLEQGKQKLYEILDSDRTHLEANFQLAVLAEKNNDNDLALSYYQKTLEGNLRSWQIYYNIGNIFHLRGNISVATNFFQTASKLASDNYHVNFKLGRLYLLQENFIDGWSTYEKTWGQDWLPRKEKLAQSNLNGTTVLICDGDGYGDTFHWIRFLPFLKQKGATIWVRARRELIPFFKTCEYVDKIITYDDPIPEGLLECSLEQLNAIFCRESVEQIPNEIPYIHADETLVGEWQSYFKNDMNFKIGICWDGKIYCDSLGNKLEKIKSLNLLNFYDLSKLPNVSLYSLQKLSGFNQLNNLPHDFTLHLFKNFDTIHGRFMDTAAIMKNLDLIITIDTSLAHLAGALGVRVWVLLPYVADWRWFLDRNDSPWHPTMRLFRQSTPGDWKSVMKMVQRELTQILNRD